jgi:hypothetical protein
MTTVNINLIRLDGGTQCRTVIDQPTIYSYLESMKEGNEFPLIETIFDGETYWLVDGFHRYHAFKLAGVQEIEINSKPGTLQDAQIEALKANSKHGKQLTNEDKRNKVEMALKIKGFDKKSVHEIAKICGVSKPFVAGIRSPEVKERQDKQREKSIRQSVHKLATSNPITSTNNSTTDVGAYPDEDEIRTSELEIEEDKKRFYRLLESNEELAAAFEEVKKLNLQQARLQVRLNGLMNERNDAVRAIKDLQKQIERHRKMARANSQTKTETRLDAEIASRNLNNPNPSNADGTFMN